MKTRLKSSKEIESMRIGGRMLALVLQAVRKEVVAGISTKALADIAAKELKALGGKPAFLNYHGFPDVICISLNDEIVHGIPSTKKIVKEGDIVSLDFGVTYNGMLTDGALSAIAGKPKSKEVQKLLEVTKESLDKGIQATRSKVRTGDIGAAIEEYLEPYGYGIPRDLVGHGIGENLWEDPNIPNIGKAGTGPILLAGMTIAIEPMVTLGTYKILVDSDGWTIRSADHSLAAHFEHTVLILENGAEILTQAA